MVNAKTFLERIAKIYNLMDENVRIYMANTKLDTKNIKDYPLMVGKEFLLRAEFKNCLGEAFTQQPKEEFSGTIKEILDRDNNDEIIATLNSVLRYLNMVDKTVHCSGEEPEECAKKLSEFLKILDPKVVGVIGFQPAIVKTLSEDFNLIVSDLNPKNVGKVKYGVKIIHGSENEELIKNSDIVLATGSTIVNGTFYEIYKISKKYNKRIIFYGTSISGMAKLLGLERFCHLGK
ncbi:Rossmann-like domain-containing protein [Methanocaldococcus sp.]